MAAVTVAEHIRATAEKVWAVAGRFDAIHEWVPAIAATTVAGGGAGIVRTLTLKGGGTLREEMMGARDEPASYTYAILDGPLPVSDYVSTLMVVPEGDSECTVSWVASFKPDGVPEDEATALISGIYKDALANLRKRLEK